MQDHRTSWPFGRVILPGPVGLLLEPFRAGAVRVAVLADPFAAGAFLLFLPMLPRCQRADMQLSRCGTQVLELPRPGGL